MYVCFFICIDVIKKNLTTSVKTLPLFNALKSLSGKSGKLCPKFLKVQTFLVLAFFSILT